MKWTARYIDGYNRRLLTYTLGVKDGSAGLTASRCNPPPPIRDFRATFPINDGPVARAIPALRLMEPRYDAQTTDQPTRVLTIEADGEILRREVYAGEILVGKRPELGPFLDLFDWIEAQVLAQFPPDGAEVLRRPATNPEEEDRAKRFAEAVARARAEEEKWEAESRAHAAARATGQVVAPRLDPGKPRHSQFFRFVCPFCTHSEEVGLWFPYKICSRCRRGTKIVRGEGQNQ
jgi:hypothetical protein